MNFSWIGKRIITRILHLANSGNGYYAATYLPLSYQYHVFKITVAHLPTAHHFFQHYLIKHRVGMISSTAISKRKMRWGVVTPPPLACSGRPAVEEFLSLAANLLFLKFYTLRWTKRKRRWSESTYEEDRKGVCLRTDRPPS